MREDEHGQRNEGEDLDHQTLPACLTDQVRSHLTDEMTAQGPRS